ncbi:MAG TPA: pyrroloquinoline quinone biosynthesis peptide chaperone PqqD [Polyangiaceae bacterium]|jgi:coenzyme PQQ biosynthesis protein PqqD|nr:pyrroloquinoline quinone biosynthesis peptide chaperone PqqD [Polyangiaceae bacterium]
MSAEAASLALKPKLSPKAKLRLDPKTGKYILLYPEKGLLLNPTGAAILKLCSGEQSLEAIIATLAAEFASDAEVLRPEVLTFVQGLLDRGLLQAAP